jgi:hypothetical protein
LKVVETVLGLGYAHARISRNATIGGSPYFGDSRAHHRIALVGGLDAPLKLGSHFSFVPTVRVLVTPPRGARGEPFGDPLGQQTRTGRLRVRYGAGARVRF